MPEPMTFCRAFPAEIESKVGNGRRTLIGRLVPYDIVTDVLDIIDGVPELYREGFKRGAFEGQLVNGAKNKGVLSRIGMIHRHEGGLGYLGPFVGLRDADDGMYGEVMVLPSKEPDVEALLEAGVQELSIEFRLRHGFTDNPQNTAVDGDGVRWRLSAHLDQVALEPKGAYSTARILQYRSDLDELAAAQAEADQQAEVEEAERAAAEKAREEEAEARIERRRSFDEMVAKAEEQRLKQAELERKYGLMKPPQR